MCAKISLLKEVNYWDAVVPLQEVEHGARVDEEDMARLIQQLEGRVDTEVPWRQTIKPLILHSVS